MEETTQPGMTPNPLLERVRIPGEIHRLPSNGLFYTNGELAGDVKDGEVHVQPMTALDEIVMRSPDLLFSGDAVKQVFGRCIPQVLKPLDLLAKDVDFLMAVLRKVTYGDQLETKYTHTCENAKEHSYMVNMDTMVKSAKAIDPTTVGRKFTAKLPNEQVVKLHPIRYSSVVKLMQATDQEASAETVNAIRIEALVDMISAVDEISDKGMIAQWLNTISAGWTKLIEDVVDNTSDWGADFEAEFVCKDCGEKIKVPTPMNPMTFFT